MSEHLLLVIFFRRTTYSETIIKLSIYILKSKINIFIYDFPCFTYIFK